MVDFPFDQLELN